MHHYFFSSSYVESKLQKGRGGSDKTFQNASESLEIVTYAKI